MACVKPVEPGRQPPRQFQSKPETDVSREIAFSGHVIDHFDHAAVLADVNDTAQGMLECVPHNIAQDYTCRGLRLKHPAGGRFQNELQIFFNI